MVNIQILFPSQCNRVSVSTKVNIVKNIRMILVTARVENLATVILAGCWNRRLESRRA